MWHVQPRYYIGRGIIADDRTLRISILNQAVFEHPSNQRQQISKCCFYPISYLVRLKAAVSSFFSDPPKTDAHPTTVAIIADLVFGF